jgi:hypothetical protein
MKIFFRQLHCGYGREFQVNSIGKQPALSNNDYQTSLLDLDSGG